MARNSEFVGAKLAILVGARLVTILRDTHPGLPWPGHWDLPGGGRDGAEDPVACALRETREEVGLRLAPSDLIWARRYVRPHGAVWFYVARIEATMAEDLQLGDEGQSLCLMPIEEFVAHRRAVPHFRDQLRDYLATLSRDRP